jgi:hypothetical protein
VWLQVALRGPREPATVEDDLKEAGQTPTIKGAGVRTAKENVLELIQLQKDKGDLQRPQKDYNES